MPNTRHKYKIITKLQFEIHHNVIATDVKSPTNNHIVHAFIYMLHQDKY
jgi:uncharacterized membrane protein